MTNKEDGKLEIKNIPDQSTFFVCVGGVDNNKNKQQMETKEGCERPPSENQIFFKSNLLWLLT